MATETETAVPPTTTRRLSAYLSRLKVVPAFPDYTGPHKVGTIDVEIPIADLESPSPAPENTDEIHTVQFRVFYPAHPDSRGKRITWLPAPQRHHLSAYGQFLGIGPLLSQVFSFIPRHIHYTSIPVNKNAELLEPDTPNGRWPTVIFSHGLGGSRNAYSHLAGSLASHGVVVICPEHRDGSTVVSFIRDPQAQDRFFIRSRRRVVPYNRIPHASTPEVWEARDRQLRIRLWELGLVHSAVVAMEGGCETFTNMNLSTPTSCMEQFRSMLHVVEPGSIIWAGHSFGAASMAQFLKSTYYADLPEVAAMERPLFTPTLDCALRRQVTPNSVTMLLDMWCFPLQSPTATELFRLPLPVYADVPSASGGNALLAVESQTFFDWTEHVHLTARMISPEPSASVVEPTAYDRPISGVRQSEPHFFYVEHSAHLNQSDFGVLFPWLTRRIFKATAPERALRLNLRAQLQLLRSNSIPIARTWVGDLVEGAHVSKLEALNAAAAEAAAARDGSSTTTNGGGGAVTAVSGVQVESEAGAGDGLVADKGPDDGVRDDKAIFDRSGAGTVEYWHWIDIVGMGTPPPPQEGEQGRDGAEQGAEAVENQGIGAGADGDAMQTPHGKPGRSGEAVAGERSMQGEIEPHLDLARAEEDMAARA